MRTCRNSYWYFLWLVLSVIACGWCGYDLYLVNRSEWSKPYLFTRRFRCLQRQIRQASPPQRMQLLTHTIDSFRKSLQWDAGNPATWHEMGYWLYRLAKYNPVESDVLLAQATVAFENAGKIKQSWYSPYWHLAKIYRRQDKLQKSDRAMATAQLLAPYNCNLLMSMALYWVTRWRQQADKIYLPLVADSFCMLNQLAFARYGRFTINIWQYLACKWEQACHPWWGTIFPKQACYATAAARFFITHENYEMAQQFLPYLYSAGDANGYLLAGHIALARGNLVKAFTLYRQAISVTDNEHRRAVTIEVGKRLTQAGKLQQAIYLLEKAHVDAVEIRVVLVEYAMALRISPGQIMQLLAATHAKFPAPHAQLFFLLSKSYWQCHKIALAMDFAEKAAQQAPRNVKYAKHLLRLMLHMDMERGIALYLQRHGHHFSRPGIIYDWMAQQYLEVDRATQALNWAQQALHCEPNNKKIRERLQTIHLRLIQQKNHK